MSYGTGVRRCVKCGRKFYSDCADICQGCFVAEVEAEKKVEAENRAMHFKLKIELVPSPLWYKGLRSKVSPEVWDKIRYEVYRASGNKCVVCGASGKLYCHEVWAYDDDSHIQKLVRLEALCELCHNVKHIGLAGIKAERGEVDYNRVIRHFMRVNGCSYEDFKAHEGSAYEVWEERSDFEWVCDFGEYAGMVV